MNKAMADLTINAWKRKNFIDNLVRLDAEKEYLEGIKFIEDVEETMKVSGVHDTAYEFLCRQRREVFRFVEALNVSYELGLDAHQVTFKVLAGFTVKNWMKDEPVTEEVEVKVNRVDINTNNKDKINREVESAYRAFKVSQGVSVFSLRDLEIEILEGPGI